MVLTPTDNGNPNVEAATQKLKSLCPELDLKTCKIRVEIYFSHRMHDGRRAPLHYAAAQAGISVDEGFELEQFIWWLT